MMFELFGLGIDVGSTTIKIVAINSQFEMIWHHLEPTQPQVGPQVKRIIKLAHDHFNVKNTPPLIATGYGRRLVQDADQHVTEITCHAKGIFREFHQKGTLIDIGGQDSKVIAIDSDGKVIDFVMNDKCAAGTGRFLENTARRLGVDIAEMGAKALSTSDESPISSTCTVFAESEIVSLIANGVALGAIVRGLHRSLVQRIVSMARLVGLTAPIMLSGGVVLNPAVCEMIAEETAEEVHLPQFPQLMGAYGAALLTT